MSGVTRPGDEAADGEAPVLVVRGLRKTWRRRTGPFTVRTTVALGGVDLAIGRGRALGLVGESGSGKTTLARCILGLVTPDAGSVAVAGTDLAPLRGRRLREARRAIGVVYQNPYLSLDPRFSVRDLVAEPIVAHARLPARRVTERVAALLKAVGLGGGFLGRRSGELSGGQAQRVAIARALALDPAFLVLDEPTSALDVSAQAQVLDLMLELEARGGMAFLFITHNLDVVREFSDDVAVMERGLIVEEGATERVFTGPAHPYTRALIDATPKVPGPGTAPIVGRA